MSIIQCKLFSTDQWPRTIGPMGRSTSHAAVLTAEFQWYRARTDSGARKTIMIVALARKLLIELWRLVTTGKVPEGVVLHAA